MIAALSLLFLIAGAMSQRSPYLSSSQDSYPGLLSRFKPPSNNSNSTGVGDRLGGPGVEEEKPVPQGGAEGTLYDQETVNRVASWPVDKQPFWYKNRNQIAQQIGSSGAQQNRSRRSQ